MKRIIQTIALSLIAISGFGQSFSMVDTARTSTGTTADYSLTNPVQIVNHTSDTLSISWNRYYEDVPAGWDISSCTPIQCMPIGVTTGSYLLDTNNTLSDYHNCHFYPNGIAGTGEARMTITNDGTGETAEVIWYAVINPVGVEESFIANLSIYPNPGREISFKGNFSEIPNFKLTLFNGIGQVVKTIENVSDGIIRIADEKPGHYIARLTSSNGLDLSRQIIITE